MFLVQEYSIHCQFMYTVLNASNVAFAVLPVHELSHAIAMEEFTVSHMFMR